MKKSVFILGCTLWGVSLSAQNENVQYQLLEGYSSSRAFNPKHIAVPDLPGYKTLKCDFHLHTYYSDGHVTPEMRVLEAWAEGLDAISQIISQCLVLTRKRRIVMSLTIKPSQWLKVKELR